MRYHDFKSAWERSLRESRLPTFGWPTETLDLARMSRRYSIVTEPYGGQDSEPFCVAAKLEFRWDALHTARTNTTEEDMLTELFGRGDAEGLGTELPWLRVDVKLSASLPYGGAIAMPSKSSLQEWAHEVMVRLERIEPLLPEETFLQTPGMEHAILGWKGDPGLEVSLDVQGGLRLQAVTLAGWQAITLPRRWDDPGREDDGPDEQLDAMFGRLKASMLAWMESLDHIRPKARGGT